MRKPTAIRKKILKPKKIEFVFIGNDIRSQQRAEAKIKNLESAGYKLVNKNSRKLTYEL